MKNIVCWRKEVFLVGIIVFLMLMMSACSNNTTNYSETGDDTHRTEQTGITTAITAIINALNGDNQSVTNPDKYVYVNNNGSTNYVSAFAIGSDGTLTELSGSPYATGGVGGGGFYASNDITLAPSKGLLFASNGSNSTISVFSINKSDGTLTLVGSPVSSGGTMNGSGSLVVSSKEDYLFVANSSSSSISVFTVDASGGLTPITGSPFSLGYMDGINMNLSGNILYATNPGNNKIIVLSVASDGSLSHITGSPFNYTAGDNITSIVLSSSTIGLVGATSGILSSYSIDATTGAPTLLHTLNTGGGNNQAVTTARNGILAILSGGQSPFISVVNVAADGSLTSVTGSPFSTAASTLGYAAANAAGTFLYATEMNQIQGFSIDTNGALTSIGTYTLTNANYARCLVIY